MCTMQLSIFKLQTQTIPTNNIKKQHDSKTVHTLLKTTKISAEHWGYLSLEQSLCYKHTHKLYTYVPS